MVTGMIRKLWTELQVALDSRFTLEGFELTGKPFLLPPDISDWKPPAKRRLTICNLFTNQSQTIPTISRVLDVSITKVVTVLIEEGIILERRRPNRRPVKRERRRPVQLIQPAAHPNVTINSLHPPPVSTSRIQTLFGATPPGRAVPLNTREAPATPESDLQV